MILDAACARCDAPITDRLVAVNWQDATYCCANCGLATTECARTGPGTEACSRCGVPFLDAHGRTLRDTRAYCCANCADAKTPAGAAAS